MMMMMIMMIHETFTMIPISNHRNEDKCNEYRRNIQLETTMVMMKMYMMMKTTNLMTNNNDHNDA